MDAEQYFKNIEARLSDLEYKVRDLGFKVQWILDYLNGQAWKKANVD